MTILASGKMNLAWVVFAVSGLFFSNLVLAIDKSNANAWVKKCGESAPSPRTVRVQSIFERVKDASDAHGKQSTLFILDCDGWPWAATLQDKNIILTRGAIEAIYSSNDPLESKDARLAFVLGHELKHVQEDDFWHEQVRRQQVMASGSRLDYGEQSKERRRHDERRADEDGFIYASLAGFDTGAVFQSGLGGYSFLNDWAQQTSTLAGDTHFTPDQRTEHLKQKFQSLANAVALFEHGVRLAHFGRYQQARVLLEDFQNLYPSAAVFNNLGYVYLQLARQEMPPEMAFRYWFTMLIDFDSGIPESVTRNTGNLELTDKAKDLLHAALNMFESGLAQNHDATVATNLVATLLYLGEYSAAQATIETIDGWDSNPQLISLDALAVMHDPRLKDPWNTHSRENFELVASKENAADSLIYNYARVLLETGREEQGVTFLLRLVDRLYKLPADYRVMICRELQEQDLADCKAEADTTTAFSRWVTEIKPGDDIDAAATRERLLGWGVPITDKLDGIDAMLYRNKTGDSLLALDGIVELVSIKRHGYGLRDQLIFENGLPQSEIPTVGGNVVLSYSEYWSALLNGKEVREIWIAK